MTPRVIEPAQPVARGGTAVRLVAARGWTAVAALALALALGIVAFTVYAVFRLHVVLPIWDAWDTIGDWRLVQAGTYGWNDLIRQHNEHRLLFPRLLFLVDQALFAMSDRDLLVETFALQAVTAAVLARFGWRRCSDRRFGAILAGFVVTMLFSLDQQQNLTSGFQVQFVGVFTAAALGAVAYAEGLGRLGAKALGGTVRPGGWSRLVLAGLACFVATYTMANGVLLGFTLVVLAALLRAPWRVTLATLVVALAAAAAFLHHYDPGADNGTADLLAHPLVYAAFVLAYVGNPAGLDTRIALVFGGLGLAGLGLAAVRTMTGAARSPGAAALVAIMGFIVASACATSYGRARYDVVQAFETRYVTPAAVFWCAFAAFWLAEIPRRGAAAGVTARAGLPVLAIVMAWLAAAATVAEAVQWPLMIGQTIQIRRLRDSLWSGLFDPDAASYENNTEATIRTLSTDLATERLSLFASPLPWRRGLERTALGEAAPAGACTGTVAATSDPQLGRDGVRLTGSAWDQAANRPVRRILTIGPDGTLSGFGSPDKPVGRPHGWTGYATAAAGQAVEADAVLGDGRICRIGDAVVAAP